VSSFGVEFGKECENEFVWIWRDECVYFFE